MSARTQVFVYGTLMRGHANHRVLVELDATFAFTATTSVPRVLVDLGPYPALLPAAADVHARHAPTIAVRGEVFDVDEAALGALDVFEGCPDLYVRERVILHRDDDGRASEAWTYVFAADVPAHAVVVVEGRYPGGGVVLVTDARERCGEVLDKRR